MSNRLKLNIATSNGQHEKEGGKREKVLKPKTENQKRFMGAIEEYDIVWGIGESGVGKTFLSAGMAAKLFKEGVYQKIIAVRPAVEVGHSLGYLPGEIEDKIKPYLRPILTELSKFFSEEDFRKYRQGECPRIELMPLTHMRGMTFEDSIIILDEAQNATHTELKMFLTRLGFGSKMIINGDPSQSDLYPDQQGGLLYWSSLFTDFEEIAVVRFTEGDIVRSHLLKKMMARM